MRRVSGVQEKRVNEATYVLQALAERSSVSRRDDCRCRGLGGSISDRRSGSGSGHGGLSQSLHNGAILHHRRSDSVLNCHRLMGNGRVISIVRRVNAGSGVHTLSITWVLTQTETKVVGWTTVLT